MSRFDKDDNAYRQHNGFYYSATIDPITHRVQRISDLPTRDNRRGDIGMVSTSKGVTMFTWNGDRWMLASLTRALEVLRDQERAKKMCTVNEARKEAGLDPVVLHGDMLIDWPV